MSDKPGDTVTLREYVDVRFTERATHFDSQVESMQKAVDSAAETMNKRLDTAATAMEKRLDSMNEFRQQMKDQAADFVTRRELRATAGLIVAASGLVMTLAMTLISHWK